MASATTTNSDIHDNDNNKEMHYDPYHATCIQYHNKNDNKIDHDATIDNASTSLSMIDWEFEVFQSANWAGNRYNNDGDSTINFVDDKDTCNDNDGSPVNENDEVSEYTEDKANTVDDGSDNNHGDDVSDNTDNDVNNNNDGSDDTNNDVSVPHIYIFSDICLFWSKGTYEQQWGIQWQ